MGAALGGYRPSSSAFPSARPGIPERVRPSSTAVVGRGCAIRVPRPAGARSTGGDLRAARVRRVAGSAGKRAAFAAVAGGSRYVTRATAGFQELKLFLEGQAADENSRTRLSDNRSVMPLDVLGRTRATLKESACFNVPGPTGFRVTR